MTGGDSSTATASHGGVHVDQADDTNGCNGVRTTPGSENTDKRLISGSLEPGGTATFLISYPVDPEDVAGRTEFEITDCVFIEDVAVAKYFIHFVPNTENFELTFTLNIPASAPVGDEYCNYAKTTAAPSTSQASNRKAGPACFVIGGALRVSKVDQAGAALAGATFSVSCTWPTSTASLAGTVITALVNGSVSDGNDANGTNDPTESFTSTSGGTLSATVVTGSTGVIAVNAPVGTSCTFTETAPPPGGYLAPAPPNNTVTLVVPGGGASATHTFVNTLPMGKLEVKKALSPTDDPGRFNLLIDGSIEAANAGHNGTTGEKTLLAGNHTVGESAGTSTSLSNYTSSISCRADNGTGAVVASSSGAGPLTVNVTNGSDIVCTITNTRHTGTLEVVKDLNPASNPGLFNLQIDGSTEAANIGDGGTTGEHTLNTGTHTVGETAGTNTNLANYSSSISCRADNGTGAVVASSSNAGPLNVNVTNGSDIVCTITNTRLTGMLQVLKDLSPDTDPGRFNLQIDGATEAANVGDGGDTGKKTLATGTHTVGETAGTDTNLSNYDSSITCKADNGAGSTVASASNAGPLNVNVTGGSDIVCTISNVRQTGTLEVVKDLNPGDDPGRFNLQIDGSTEAANVGDGGTSGEQTLNTGTYAVGETAGTDTSLANYTSSIECRDQDGAGAIVASTSTAGPVNVAVGDGDDIVCTITNTRQTGTLEVVKDLNPADDPGLFNLQIDGSTEASNVGDGGSTGEHTLNTGNHSVGETAGTDTSLSDYASSISCRDDDGEGSTVASASNAGPLNVNVTDGSDIVCTITNTRDTGTLEVVKDLNPASDPGLFNLQINGSTEAANVGDEGTTGPQTLNTGTHSVGETAGTATSLSNYTTSIACRDDDGEGDIVASGIGAGPLNVAVGDDDEIVCVITNTRQTGTLEVVKDLNPASDPGNFNLQIDGSTEAADVGDGGTTGEHTLNTGTHTVGETAGTSTSLGNYSSSIECRSNNGAGSVVASGSGAGPLNVNVTNGSDIVCVITNTRVTVGFNKVNDEGDNAAVEPGETIRFTLSVIVNNGTATNVEVTDELPDGLTYVPNSANPSTGFSIVGQDLTWIVGTLAEGTHTFVYDATVDADASGSLTNVGCVDADQNDELVCDETTLRVQNISVLKTNGTTGSVVPGTAVDFTLTLDVINGPIDNVTIVDQLPTGIGNATLISDGGTYSAATNQITWNLTNVADNETLTYRAVVSASATAGNLTNVAEITDGPCVGDGCEDTSTVTVRVPSLVIDKVASTETITITGPNDALVATPSVVTWTISYTLASGPVTGAVITDTIPTGFTFLDAANGGTFADGTITWNLGTLSASGAVTFRTTVNPATISRTGPTVNTATIDSNETNPDTGQDSVTVVVEAPPLGGNPTPTPAPLPDTASGDEPFTLPILLLLAFLMTSIGALTMPRVENRTRHW